MRVSKKHKKLVIGLIVAVLTSVAGIAISKTYTDIEIHIENIYIHIGTAH